MIDEYQDLSTEELIKILDIILEELNDRIKDKGIILKISNEAKKYIVENEIDLNYGARQLKRRVQELIEDKIAERLVEESLKKDGIIEIYLDEGTIKDRVINKDV